MMMVPGRFDETEVAAVETEPGTGRGRGTGSGDRRPVETETVVKV